MSLISTIISLYGVDTTKYSESGAALYASLSNPAKPQVPVLDQGTDGAKNDDEQRWLEEHIDLLFLGPTDIAKQRRSRVVELIRKIPLSIITAMVALAILIFLFMVPPLLISGYGLVHSKVAMAKVAMSVLIAIMSIMGYKLIGV